MGCDQSNERKIPVTEDEKKKMTEPWAVDKCPKQYNLNYWESNWMLEKIITIVHVAFPRTSPSVTALIKELSSLLSSSQPPRRTTISASAEEAKIFHIAMELIKNSISEPMIYHQS